MTCSKCRQCKFSHSLVFSRAKAHEILALLDREEQCRRDLHRLDAIDRELKVTARVVQSITRYGRLAARGKSRGEQMLIVHLLLERDASLSGWTARQQAWKREPG